jgi:hypothetical protein
VRNFVLTQICLCPKKSFEILKFAKWPQNSKWCQKPTFNLNFALKTSIFNRYQKP